MGHCNNGRQLVNLCGERGIDTLLYMGVASNMCVQHRCSVSGQMAHCVRQVTVSSLAADRNDVPGLEALHDADLLVLSIRRRALPVVQMNNHDNLSHTLVHPERYPYHV